MKKKKLLLLVIVILLVFLSICCISLNAKDSNKNEELILGISDYRLYKDNEVVNVIGDLYFLTVGNQINIVKNDGKSGLMVDYGTVRGAKYDFGYMVYVGKDAFFFENSGICLRKFDSNIVSYHIDDITNKVYFSQKVDGRLEIFDREFNLVFKKDNEYVDFILDNLLYSNSKIYDLNNGNQVGTYEHEIKLGDKFYLINGVNKLVDRENKKIYDVVSYKQYFELYDIKTTNGDFIIDKNGILRDDIYVKKINDIYYMDASSCQMGWKLKKDDEIIYDACAFDYDLSKIEEDIYIVYGNDSKYYYVYNGQLSRPFSSLRIVGNYIYGKDYLEDTMVLENNIYDLKGNIVLENIDDFEYIGDDKYILYGKSEDKILDKDLKEIVTYESIEYKDKILIVKKNDRYGIYYNNRELISPSFMDIKVFNGKIVLKDIAFDAVVYLDEVKSNKDLSELFELKSKYYENINIKEIKDTYKLDENIISKDNELFKKYAYVLENNKKINGFKDKLYIFYNSIIDNKNYIDTDTFLYGLRRLNITVQKEVSVKGAAGVYNDANKNIELLEGNVIPSVYYHELYHFLDFNSGIQKNYTLYRCDNLILDIEEYNKYTNKDKCVYLYIPYTQFMTEAGAEIYSVDYFIESKTVRAYQWGTYVYEMLNYLLGNNEMKRIFYSMDTNYELFNVLVNKYGMSVVDYNEMITVFNKLTQIDTMYDVSIMEKAKDWLIYLYNIVNSDKNINEDIEFLYYMRYAKGNERYQDRQRELHDINANIMLEIYNVRKPYNIKEFKIRDKGTYIYFEVLDNNYSIIDNIRVLYDFKSNKIIEYERLEGV